jgi:hypothetical protein
VRERVGVLMRYAAVALVLLGTASVARAQDVEVRLALTQARTNHRLLGDPGGPVAGAALALSSVFALRVTVNHLAHDQTRTGRACAGLLPPDPAECPVESIQYETSMSGVALGLVATVARRGNLALAIVPSAGVFRGRSKAEGLQTGNQLSGTNSMIGFAAGVELSVVPHAPWPVALHVGVHAGRMLPGDDAPTVDGYNPFIDSIRITRAEVGLAIRIPRRAPR